MFILKEVIGKFHHAIKKGSVTIAGKPSVDVHPEIINSVLKQAQISKNKK